MRALSALTILAVLATVAPRPADAQYAPPRGSYQGQCRDIRMEGQFLKAWCRGSRGAGESAINVASCSTDIGVDPDGGLICGGPGGAYPTPPIASPPPGNPPPAYPPGGGYSPPQGGHGAPLSTTGPGSADAPSRSPATRRTWTTAA